MITKLHLLKKINDLSDNPCLDNVFAIVKILVRRYPKHKVKDLENRLLTNPKFQNFWQKYQPPESVLKNAWDTEYLEGLPEGTLGKEICNFWKRNKITQEELTPLEENNLLKVVANRLIKTHDIWHVLAGYEIEPIDEYGLQAFYLGQEASLAAFSIMSAGFWRILKQGKAREIPDLMDRVAQGYLNGKKAKNILYVVWEDYWEMSIEEIRQQFKIQPFSC